MIILHVFWNRMSKKMCWEMTDKIVNENSHTCWSRKPTSTIVGLVDQSHLLQERHVIANGCWRHPYIIFFEEWLRSGNSTKFNIFLNNDLENGDFASIYFFHNCWLFFSGNQEYIGIFSYLCFYIFYWFIIRKISFEQIHICLSKKLWFCINNRFYTVIISKFFALCFR
jgi:hypothetical protein